MYSITGITGQVGAVVARALLTEGANVRAVARDASKAAPWVERRCELAIAKMSDAAALARAFAGAEGVFVLIPPIFDPSPGFAEASAVISAVRDPLAQARPARTVCLSTVGAQAAQPNLLNQLAMLYRSPPPQGRSQSPAMSAHSPAHRPQTETPATGIADLPMDEGPNTCTPPSSAPVR